MIIQRLSDLSIQAPKIKRFALVIGKLNNQFTFFKSYNSERCTRLHKNDPFCNCKFGLAPLAKVGYELTRVTNHKVDHSEDSQYINNVYIVDTEGNEVEHYCAYIYTEI